MKPTTKLFVLTSILFVCFVVGCAPIQDWRRKHFGCAGGNEVVQFVESAPVPTPANAFVSTHYGKLKPRRVVIISPNNRMQLFPEQTKFAEALSFALKKKGVMETVVGKPCACDIHSIQAGRFSEDQLVQLAERYNADAVLYCDVVDFSAYAPLSASISLSLIDARESVVLLSTDGAWDLRNPDDANQFRMLLSQYGDEAEIAMRFDSPSEFMTFIGILTADFISQF